MYSELHASSAFSFLDGASLPEALVDRAAALGYRALALLDRDGVYGAPRFLPEAIANTREITARLDFTCLQSGQESKRLSAPS